MLQQEITTRIPREGERIRLRKVKVTDAELFEEYLMNEEVSKWLYRNPKKRFQKTKDAFIRRLFVREKERSTFYYCIEDKLTKVCIGAINLHNIDEDDAYGELGFWLGREYWGKGYMQEALGLFLPVVFDEWGFHKIGGVLTEDNELSIRAIERAGFILEGMLRDHVFRCGEWRNKRIYGMLKEEYKRKK